MTKRTQPVSKAQVAAAKAILAKAGIPLDVPAEMEAQPARRGRPIGDKSEQAATLYRENMDLTQTDLLKLMQSELGITYANAYYYFKRFVKTIGKPTGENILVEPPVIDRPKRSARKSAEAEAKPNHRARAVAAH